VLNSWYQGELLGLFSTAAGRHGSVSNMVAANPTFDRAGSQLKFREGGGFDPS
jgi:hypothetical protein